VTDGGGGKAGDNDGDAGEGAKQATLSACGKRTAMEEADGYGTGRPLDTGAGDFGGCARMRT
jgi:hypothetical protein